MAEHMTIGTDKGFVVERIHLPRSMSKNFVLFYNDGRLAVRADHNALTDEPAEFIDIDEPFEFDVDDSERGERKPWGMGHFAYQHADYLIEGTTWRVLIDNVGWPFIIIKEPKS